MQYRKEIIKAFLSSFLVILDEIKSNMMIRRISILIVFTFFTCILSAQVGVNTEVNNNLIGFWQNNQFGYQMIIVMNQDGSGEIDGESFRYSVQDDKLSVRTKDETTVYNYSLQGNTLTLSGGDLVQGVVFTKQVGAPTVTESVITYNESPGQQAVGGSENPSDILGVWTSKGETIEFTSDGQCVYLGHSYPYKISEGQILLSTADGDALINYAIQEEKLSLTFNGTTVTYSRAMASEVGENQQIESPREGNIAPELVGKWCFVDVSSYNEGASSTTECISLNADGTYEYFTESSRSVNTPDLYGGTSSQISDRGTWSFKDGLLYYNSQARGQGSLILEKKNHPKNVNDPMIVLNGRAFVTQTIKAPW